MTTTVSFGDDRFRLGGIKFSLELVQINSLDRPGECLRTGRLLRLLAERRINLPFFFYSPGFPRSISSLGLEVEEFDQVESTLMGDPDLSPGLETIRPVGTLTLFPHRSDLALLGRVLRAWGRSGFPLYGMGTSISTVTISTDYRLLDRAFEALKTLLGLPENTVPQRPEFRVKQVR
jgi:hypothetical protein